MSNDCVTIEERYGNAVEATDLTLRFERGGPLDVLTAAGMVGARRPLSLSVWRWIYGEDHNERHAVLAGLLKWAKKRGRRCHWRGAWQSECVRVVVTVADWYSDKTCRHCHGTRYEVIPGTPALSDEPCQVCHGSGERSLDKLLMQFGPDWIGRGHDMRSHLDVLISDAAHDMLKKMRKDIDSSGL
ncbi:MAG: hypothetical protein ACRCVK_19730 [Aeromonas veronii]